MDSNAYKIRDEARARVSKAIGAIKLPVQNYLQSLSLLPVTIYYPTSSYAKTYCKGRSDPCHHWNTIRTYLPLNLAVCSPDFSDFCALSRLLLPLRVLRFLARFHEDRYAYLKSVNTGELAILFPCSMA